MAAIPPLCNFDWHAPDFSLPATDGKTYSLADIAGENGTLIMFICNHCPYVLAILDRIKRDAADLQALGIGVAAICSNDANSHPDDSFENMVILSKDQGFTFPYLHDETQAVARGYDAVCTPDFFGFNSQNQLQYRGRLDASRKDAAGPDVRRDLFESMKQVAQTGKGPEMQIPSMGCSIKWRET
ncbi:MAG: thioredoxin family protein [Paracoccaceae bacterium]